MLFFLPEVGIWQPMFWFHWFVLSRCKALAAEMSRLTDVVLVGNRDLYEIRELQQSEQIEQHTRLK